MTGLPPHPNPLPKGGQTRHPSFKKVDPAPQTKALKKSCNCRSRWATGAGGCCGRLPPHWLHMGAHAGCPGIDASLEPAPQTHRGGITGEAPFPPCTVIFSSRIVFIPHPPGGGLLPAGLSPVCAEAGACLETNEPSRPISSRKSRIHCRAALWGARSHVHSSSPCPPTAPAANPSCRRGA
jgi:hypothetical protein